MTNTKPKNAATIPMEVSPSSPPGAIAVLLLSMWKESLDRSLVFLSASERAAEQLGSILYGLDPQSDPLVLPRWDALPYDRAAPSREVADRRASVLRRLSERPKKALLLATAEAALQRVPAPNIWSDTTLCLRLGMALDESALRSFLERSGYELGGRVDTPGEAAIEGQVTDIFSAGGLSPVRVVHAEGWVTALSAYDPASQRTCEDIAEVTIDPASEMTVVDTEDSPAGRPLRLPATFFDYVRGAALIIDPGVEKRVDAWLDQVAEVYESSKWQPGLHPTTGAASMPPSDLYLDKREWRAALGRHTILDWPDTSSIDLRVPKFAATSAPLAAFRRFIEEQCASGHRVVLAASDEKDRRVLERRARPAAAKDIALGANWSAIDKEAGGSVTSLALDLDEGFRLPSSKITVLAAADLLGSRAIHDVPLGWRDLARSDEIDVAKPGDLVIHLERGVGRLRGLETIESEGEPAQDVVRLEFAAAASVLIPVEELALLWKYGSHKSVRLDGADGSSWQKRRVELARHIEDAVTRLVALTEERRAKRGPKLVPPAPGYERLVARFPYMATPDQASAAADVLADLASGGLMDRLVCGDVGFGKTEIALRAAAAALLSGKQVALVVPTTVLARQHLETFRRRFAGFDIAIALLSRFASASERRLVTKGLADGTIRLVIGTQAIAGKAVRFKELGLVIIDEEQHFGTRDKEKLRGRAGDVHVLTLTATPIPRTMQLALAGLRDLSLLATAPQRRLPVHTEIAAFAEPLVRRALLYEKQRRGQSFIVCPRIEDLEPWVARLEAIVPELSRVVVHGKMPASDIDDSMMAFAAGEADILLATNIVENGLDLPRANTILIWHPDRFGMAQLHQLRGRVGRGSRRGYAYLMTEDSAAMTVTGKARLEKLRQFDQLGAGFRLGESDLDLRGGGDLFGESQVGHLKLVGPALYRHLFDRAVRALPR